MSIEVFQQRILPMKDKLFRFAYRLLQNVEEAEDAVQEVMVSVWMKRDQWERWDNLEAYCMTATRNHCLDRFRKKRPVSVGDAAAVQVSSGDKDPYEKMMGKELIYRIRKCLDELPPNQQMVVRLREMDGFSYNEIASILDMSMEQVKINLFRGRNAIKKLITKEENTWNTQQ
ncbi:MAG TPA: sigma-70 family RNA polymerase sigma factor [Puia sp.]|nr:sigma-70 family RNA polymerase sigma factor [Puia sp.]